MYNSLHANSGVRKWNFFSGGDYENSIDSVLTRVLFTPYTGDSNISANDLRCRLLMNQTVMEGHQREAMKNAGG